MIVLTINEVPGREITEAIGLVRGTAVRARHLGRDIVAICRTIVGGEVPEYTKLVAETREQALDRLVADARARGADAVVGFRFGTSEVAKAAAEVVAYGTAVKLAPKS
tara:strand:+ start:12109 stop:12432 length:324 start_codon:yes stop_codon:yes gene_type:complete